MAHNSFVADSDFNGSGIFADGNFEFNVSDVEFDNSMNGEYVFNDLDGFPQRNPLGFGNSGLENQGSLNRGGMKQKQSLKGGFLEKNSNKINGFNASPMEKPGNGFEAHGMKSNFDPIPIGEDGFHQISLGDDFVGIGGKKLTNGSQNLGSNKIKSGFDSIPIDDDFASLPIGGRNVNFGINQNSSKQIGGFDSISMNDDDFAAFPIGGNNGFKSPIQDKGFNEQYQDAHIESQQIPIDNAPTSKRLLPGRLLSKISPAPAPFQGNDSKLFAEAPQISLTERQNVSFNQPDDNVFMGNGTTPLNSQKDDSFHSLGMSSPAYVPKKSQPSLIGESTPTQKMQFPNSPQNIDQVQIVDQESHITTLDQNQLPSQLQNQLPVQGQISNQIQSQNQTKEYAPQGTLPIEHSFASSLDRSISNLRRQFATELSSVIRPSPLPVQLEVEDFTERLSSEVSQLIGENLPPADLNIQSISRRISQTIEEHTKPVGSALAEAESRNASAADAHISELRQLQDELDSLRSTLKGATDSLLKELDKERQLSASNRDSEIDKSREAEQRLRTLKLSGVGLETRQRNLQAEADAVSRSLKNIDQRRREWETGELPRLTDEGGALRARILQELSNLRKHVLDENYTELATVLDEGVRVVSDEAELLRSELLELDLVNRSVAAQGAVKQKPSPGRGRRSTRRTRDDLIRDFTEQFR